MQHEPNTTETHTGTDHRRVGRALFVAIVATALFAGAGGGSALGGGGTIDPNGNIASSLERLEPGVPGPVLTGGGTVDPSGN